MIANGRANNGIVDLANVPAKRRAVMKLCPACGLKQSGGRRTCMEAKCGYEFRTKNSYRTKKKSVVPVATVEKLVQTAQIVPPTPTDNPIEIAVRSLVDAIKSNLVDEKSSDSIHDDIRALREENRQLRASIESLDSTIKYFRIFITDTLKLEPLRREPIPQIEDVRPRRKSIAIIGLLPDQQKRVKEVLDEKANLIFMDADKRREMPMVDYVISSRHTNHSINERAASVVGNKNFKFLPTTNVQDVIQAGLNFLSRQ